MIDAIGLAVVAGALATMLSCVGGGDDSGSSSPADIGDDERVVNELTEAAAEQACLNATRHVRTTDDWPGNQHAGCIFFGLLVKEGPAGKAKCEEVYDECMEDADTPDDEGWEEVDCSPSRAELAECDASLGEIEACLDEQRAIVQWEMAQWRMLDCSDSMNDVEMMSNLEQGETSPGCVALEDKCSFLLW